MEKFRSLLVRPNLEIKQDSDGSDTLGIKGLEKPVSAIMKGLHIHQDDKSTTFSLENPIVGGPAVIHDGKSDNILIPGTKRVIKGHNATLFIKVKDTIQMLILGDG